MRRWGKRLPASGHRGIFPKEQAKTCRVGLANLATGFRNKKGRFCGIVTLASFTCQWRVVLMGRTQRNQWLAELESGAGHLENPLFVADVTMPTNHQKASAKDHPATEAIVGSGSCLELKTNHSGPIAKRYNVLGNRGLDEVVRLMGVMNFRVIVARFA